MTGPKLTETIVTAAVVCRFCGDDRPDDWCPGCGAFMCNQCAHGHRGALDGTCRQDGERVAAKSVCGIDIGGDDR